MFSSLANNGNPDNGSVCWPSFADEEKCDGLSRRFANTVSSQGVSEDPKGEATRK